MDERQLDYGKRKSKTCQVIHRQSTSGRCHYEFKILSWLDYFEFIDEKQDQKNSAGKQQGLRYYPGK
jgi:hypothetical protein